MKTDIKKTPILKFIKIFASSLAIILLAMFTLPAIFPQYISNKVQNLANENLNGELSFNDANLSFFTHFPSLTLTLDQFLLKGSVPFPNDTLVSANSISLGINLKSLLFNKTVDINKIYVDNAFINVKVNENGLPNYNVYTSTPSENTDDSSANIKLQKIEISNTHLKYDDRATKMLIDAKGFNYKGKGDLDQAIFDLYTIAHIDSFNFSFDGNNYFENKEVNADLITKINTNSLSFIFDKNDLKINKLPIEFKGKFDFLSNGYDIDFNIKSENSNLQDFFTALPPQYITWMEKVKMNGNSDILFTLKGKYIASENLSPDMALSLKVRDGYVSHPKSQTPAKNIYVNLETKLPSLNPENLILKIDSVYFDLGNDYFSGILDLNGLKTPNIKAKIKSKINLEKISKILDIDGLSLKGDFIADINSNGIFDKEKGIFPITKGDLKIKNGSIKTAHYPNPITNINVNSQLTNNDGSFKSGLFVINPATFSFEDKPFNLTATFSDFQDINYDLQAKGELDIAKIYKVFSQNGLDLEGYASANIHLKGKQSDATQGRFHKLDNKGSLVLKNIKTTSEFLPHPFVINEGNFSFHQEKMNFTNFKATYGTSDFLMNGYMNNVINFILSDNQVLKGRFSVKSDYLNIDEFLAQVNENETPEKTESKQTETNTNGVIVIPKIFDFGLMANFKKVDFQDLTINNVTGATNIKNGTISLNNVKFGIIGSTATINASYKDETPSKADFKFDIDAKDFNIKRAYKEIKLFREMASAAESAEGIVSLKYNLNGKLDANMSPVFPSLTGGGTLSVKNVKMKGFKMFNVISNKTETSALKDPDLSKVDIKTTIKNNIINIERFKFKVAGFRPRFEGQSSFDGKLNLKMRLGLPPLGIIGIPITVTGTQDNPKVKIGRKTEDLEETEYDE